MGNILSSILIEQDKKVYASTGIHDILSRPKDDNEMFIDDGFESDEIDYISNNLVIKQDELNQTDEELDDTQINWKIEEQNKLLDDHTDEELDDTQINWEIEEQNKILDDHTDEQLDEQLDEEQNKLLDDYTDKQKDKQLDEEQNKLLDDYTDKQKDEQLGENSTDKEQIFDKPEITFDMDSMKSMAKASTKKKTPVNTNLNNGLTKYIPYIGIGLLVVTVGFFIIKKKSL